MLKQIKIQTEHVELPDGSFGRKILFLQALSKHQLPDAYVNVGTSCHYVAALDGRKPGLIVNTDNGGQYSLSVGQVISKERFGTILALIRKAANRFREINQVTPLKDRKARSMELFVI